VEIKGKSTVFVFTKKWCKKWRFFREKFIKSEELEKRIRTTCSFNNATCEFRQGRILYIAGTNISFIEPHKVDVTKKGKKLILIYF